MSRRPNRVILLITAVVLVTAAAVVLLAAAGLLDLLEPSQLFDRAESSAAAYPLAWTGGILVVGALCIALGAWLVRRQLRVRPGGRLDTVTVERGDRGRTTAQAAPIADAVAADLRRVRGVTGSDVRLVTFGDRPRLIVDLDVAEGASLRDVLDRSEAAYERLEDHLGVKGVHVDTVLQPSAQSPPRVR